MITEPTIIKIEWLDYQSKEAEIEISDGTFTITTFAHPFSGAANQPISQPLYALLTTHVYRSRLSAERVERIGKAFEHSIDGYVVSREQNKIQVGQFYIRLDADIPKDVEKGELIHFSCQRLDLEG